VAAAVAMAGTLERLVQQHEVAGLHDCALGRVLTQISLCCPKLRIDQLEQQLLGVGSRLLVHCTVFRHAAQSVYPNVNK
jgi:hypothetical protein